MTTPGFDPSQENPKPKKLVWQKKFFWPVLAGVFAIIVYVIALFICWQRFTRDDLINFAPVDSLAYVFIQDSILPWSENKITLLPLNNFFNQTPQKEIFSNLDLKNDILNHTRQAAFIVLFDDEHNLQEVFIFKFRNEKKLLPLANKLKYTWVVNHDTLLVASDQATLTKVQETKNGLNFSLRNKVDTAKTNRAFFNLYFSSSQLKSYLETQTSPLNKIFIQLLNDDFYFSLKQKSGRLIFQFDEKFLANEQNQAKFISTLPNNFSFFVSGFNLYSVVKKIMAADPSLDQFIQQVDESFNALYSFNLEKSVKLFDQPSSLIIFDRLEKNYLGFDYLLVLPKATSAQLNDFESLIKIILAQKLPTQKPYVLADGSQAVELIAEPEIWHWQEEKVGDNNTIHFLVEPDLNFMIAYLDQLDFLLIASSDIVLKNFLAPSNFDLNQLTVNCPGFKLSSPHLIFNPAFDLFGLKRFMPDGQFVIWSNGWQTTGCFNR